MFKNTPLPVLFVFIFFFGSFLGLGVGNAFFSNITPSPTPAPLPTPFNPFPYKIPTIPYDRAYVTFLVGDSHTDALGVNANELRLNLIKLYPDHEFVNYNYGYGATNILSLDERLHQETTYKGTKSPSILSQRFDLIVIESFGYNPLSENAVEEGIKKHLAALEKAVLEIIESHPNSVVAIMTPIAPSRDFFAKGVYELSAEQRASWAEERISYINSVTNFAGQRGLPLINVFEKSLKPDGNVDLKYVNPSDYIHPSKAGVTLMAQTIANFIFDNKIFPE